MESSTKTTQCESIAARLGPKDLAGKEYVLTVSGSIKAGPEKINYKLEEIVPPDLNPAIIALKITPSPTRGDTEHVLKTYSKTYNHNPKLTKVRVNDGDSDCIIDIEIFFS